MGDGIKGFKGFDKNLKCRDMQYEVGKEYTAEGEIKACRNGLHMCERPLDVLKYYSPANGRYGTVEGNGDRSTDLEDSKIAFRRLKITGEIGIPGLVKAQIEYTKARTTTEHTDPKQATAGNRGAATAGDSGAATSRGTVSVGENGAGLARGNGVKVKGGLGAILVICEENDHDYGIKSWKAAEVDGETIKANTYYILKSGEFVEADDAESE